MENETPKTIDYKAMALSSIKYHGLTKTVNGNNKTIKQLRKAKEILFNCFGLGTTLYDIENMSAESVKELIIKHIEGVDRQISWRTELKNTIEEIEKEHFAGE